jgi:hypothetical protein
MRPTRREPPTAPPVPLTHHDIAALAAPFTRAGRLVDLAASDRAARRLRFKPLALDGVLEGLSLDEDKGSWRLTRSLTDDTGLCAQLQARGDDVAALCEPCLAVPVASAFSRGAGWAIAWSHQLAEAGPRLQAAELRLDGLTLRMSVSSVDRIPADIRLEAPDITELPSDLLAVLGLRWARLDRQGSGWRSSLALRSRGAARSGEAQAQLQAAAAHLAHTLARPPAHFHDAHLGLRWAVTARRAVPLLACVGIIGAALAVPALNLQPDSVLRMLIFNAPPLLLGLFVVLREMPRVELPPLPRRPAAAHWRRAPLPETR